MEDWQNSSLEEKVDLENLVLFPPDGYLDTERRKYDKDIKEDQSEENSDFIENPSNNNIKTEKVELIEPDNDTQSFEFSINGGEICQICGLEFGNKAVLKIHNSLLHPEEKKDGQNVDLGRKDEVIHEHEIAKSDHLKKEGWSHKGLKPFKCSICDFKTGLKQSLKRHIESVHEGIKPFKCSICEYKTGQNSHLKKHIENLHEGIKTFNCIICDYKTAYKSDYEKHIKSVHEGIKPFKCSICDYETAYKQSLKKHTKAVHERVKPHRCSICKVKFALKQTLKRHIDSVHE